jgi:hemerythrin superfamily protein
MQALYVADRRPDAKEELSMTQAQQALAAIKAYMVRQPSEQAPAHGLAVWEAVIRCAEGYNEQASAAADPSHTNEQAVFADGSRLWWNAELNAWETGPAETDAAEDAAVVVAGNRRLSPSERIEEPARPTAENTAVVVAGNRRPSPSERIEEPTRPIEAIALLQADHRKVQHLFARYQSAPDFPTKEQIAAQVFTELDVHAQLEETVFYPAFDAQAGKKGTQLVADSRLAHEAVRELMIDMQRLNTEEEFEAKFHELIQCVQHHIAQEETEMFPEAAQILADQLADLLDEMVALKHQLMTAPRQ